VVISDALPLEAGCPTSRFGCANP